MKNPIKDNRIIDKTFAIRLRNFVEDVEVGDACSEDEKEALLNYTNELLRYQVFTATEDDEIDYLKRVGVYDNSYLIKTYDDVEIYDKDVSLFSCMKNPTKGENIIPMKVSYILNRAINKDRIFFSKVNLAKEYIENNILRYSKSDLAKIISSKKR